MCLERKSDSRIVSDPFGELVLSGVFSGFGPHPFGQKYGFDA